MRSHTPFADPTSFSLRRHLADTTIGPAEIYALTLAYYTDPGSIAVLCEHVMGSPIGKQSFRLLVGLYTAQAFDVLARPADPLNATARTQTRDMIGACAVVLARRASEADLLEGLHTARTVFAGSTHTFRDGPLFVSELFAANAPDEALTDRATAEMSIMQSDVVRLSPELAREPRKRAPTPDIRHTRHTVRAASRLLLSRFGTHVPSWDMFKHLYSPVASIGATVDLVAKLEQSN